MAGACSVCQERAEACHRNALSRSVSSPAAACTRPASTACAWRIVACGITTSRVQISICTNQVRNAATSVAVACSARRFHSGTAYGAATGTGAGARCTGSSIHSPSLTRGCQPSDFRCERIRTSTRMFAPTVNTTAFAIDGKNFVR